MSKQKKQDCFEARILVRIPLTHDDPQSYPTALKAVSAMGGGLPAGSTLDVLAQGFAKMPATEAPTQTIAGDSAGTTTTVQIDSLPPVIPPFLKRRA